MDVKKDIEKAVEILNAGGIILYPTDTIWGLGCDATNENAVKRIFELKRRPQAKAMISLVDSEESLIQWLEYVPEAALREIRNKKCRPLTVIYDKPKGIATPLKADDGSAAFRITNHYYSNALCAGLGRPIVSTSANYAGDPSPASFNGIDDNIKKEVDYICKCERESASGSPSRIVKINDEGNVKVIRE